MGNSLLQPQNSRQTNPLKSFEEFLLQNPDLSDKQYLSENKFFRTASFSFKNDAKIILKVYLKRAVLSYELLAAFHQNFLSIKDRLTSRTYPNLFPYMKLLNFEQPEEDFLAITRQSLHTTLKDRFHSLPKLTSIETLWILTQVIIGLYNLHSEGFFHGDLKTSNVLLTTWNHAYIADFACCHKPLYIDDISVFRAYFSTSESNCSLAPEKFQPNETTKDLPTKLQELPSEIVLSQQKMDIFSLGCVIAEAFLKTQPLFTYEQLQLYIKGLYEPSEVVKGIKDLQIQKLVLCLINKDPSKRMKSEEVLKFWFLHIVTNNVFDVLFYIDSTLNNPNFSLPDERIALFKKLFPLIYEEFVEFNQNNIPLLHENLPLPIQELNIMQGLVKSIREIKPNLFELLKKQPPALFLYKEENSFKIAGSSLENLDNCREKDISTVINSFKLKKHVLNKGRIALSASNTLLFPSKGKSLLNNPLPLNDPLQESYINKGNDSLDLILLMICCNIRNLRYSSSKLVALELLKRLSKYVSDSSKFHIICPYLCCFFDDPSINEGNDSLIVSTAFSLFCEVISSIKDPFQTINDCKLYSAFVWVNIKRVIELEKVDLIQSAFARNLHVITETCRTFLLETYTKKSPLFSQTDSDYIKDLEVLKKTIFNGIQNILSHTNSDIQEILLNNLHKLCSCDLFDSETCDNEIMVLIISCLNKKKQVCLSLAPNIAQNFTSKAVNSMLKPCLEICLYDSDEMVVLETIRCFKDMSRLKLLNKANDEELLCKIAPLVMYPNLWIREEAFGFIGTILEKYSPVEIYCYIQPLLHKYFKENMMLSKEILEFVMPEMLEKDQVKSFRELSKAQKAEMKFDNPNFELFYKEYLSMASPLVYGNDNEEYMAYNENLAEINISNCKNLVSRLNSIFMMLLLENYPENVVSLMDLVPLPDFKEKKEIRIEDLIEAFKTVLIKDNFIDITSQDITGSKGKLLASWALKISKDWESSLSKRHRNSWITRFLQNIVLEINSVLYKMKQFDVRTETGGIDPSKGEINKGKVGGGRFWRPSGTLVTTIYEHEDVVSCLETLKDNRRFISGGYDGWVKVFDLERIEKYIYLFIFLFYYFIFGGF